MSINFIGMTARTMNSNGSHAKPQIPVDSQKLLSIECITQEMLAERGVNVDHTTIYRWVQRYAPEMKNGCAGTGETLPDSAPGTLMKHT
jgi:hypothetical protein